MMQNKRSAFILGLIGEAGSGKTTLAMALKESFHAHYISGDLLGHRLQETQEVIELIRNTFGENVISEGKVNRQALGQIVFNDSEQLEVLNGLMLPRIREALTKEINKYKEEVELIILDGALLIEAECHQFCDRMAYVYTDQEIRFKRLTNKRHIDPKRVQAMMNSQKSIAFYVKNSQLIFNMNEGINSAMPLIKVQVAELLS